MQRMVHRISNFPTRWLGSYGTARSDLDLTVKYTADYIEIESIALVYFNDAGDTHIACADPELSRVLIPKIEADDDIMDELGHACGNHEAQVRENTRDRHFARERE